MYSQPADEAAAGDARIFEAKALRLSTTFELTTRSGHSRATSTPLQLQTPITGIGISLGKLVFRRKGVCELIHLVAEIEKRKASQSKSHAKPRFLPLVIISKSFFQPQSQTTTTSVRPTPPHRPSSLQTGNVVAKEANGTSSQLRIHIPIHPSIRQAPNNSVGRSSRK